MRIGIVCYATVGGSGVVATELAHALAFRGHDIHLISAELPFRWRWGTPGLTFERVDTPSYPLFREPQYLLALTSTLVRVSRQHKLDVIHAHYAVPHATAAYLAHQILAADPGRPPRTVTTLHGTDITLVGSDPSYASVVGFSIEASHGVTAVSESLKRDTFSALGVRRDIRVIPNFLECSDYRRQADDSLRARLCPSGECDALVMHVSNFRSVKRVELVVEIFRRIRAKVRARLVMVGDGPDWPAVERQVGRRRLVERRRLRRRAARHRPVAVGRPICSCCPRRRNRFGLAALEAMSCEVPVVASRVGGIPEVVVGRRHRLRARPGRPRRHGRVRHRRARRSRVARGRLARPRPPTWSGVSAPASSCRSTSGTTTRCWRAGSRERTEDAGRDPPVCGGAHVTWLAVGVGGALGAMARHGLQVALTRWPATVSFPIGIFFINVLGSGLIGVIAGAIASSRLIVSAEHAGVSDGRPSREASRHSRRSASIRWRSSATDTRAWRSSTSPARSASACWPSGSAIGSRREAPGRRSPKPVTE